MTVLLLAHLVLGLGLIAWGGRASRLAVAVAGVAPAATVVWLVARGPGALDGRPVTESVQWVPALGVDLDLRLDGFAVLFAALV